MGRAVPAAASALGARSASGAEPDPSRLFDLDTQPPWSTSTRIVMVHVDQREEAAAEDASLQ